MAEYNITALKLFNNANKFIEAYHTVLQPICRETGLPPMAVDILLFIANNPKNGTAKDICMFHGLKPGIVSVHVDRLVNEDLLIRQGVPGDRRKTQLSCTEKSVPIIEEGRELQKKFAQKLLVGLNDDDVAVFRNCLTVLAHNMENIRKNGI